MDPLDAEYIRRKLDRAIRMLYDTQGDVAERNIYAYPNKRQTGFLRYWLQEPEAFVTTGLTMIEGLWRYPLYMRVLDMKSHGDKEIYNIPVYYMTKDLLEEIEHEYCDWMHSQVYRDLKDALKAMRD